MVFDAHNDILTSKTNAVRLYDYIKESFEQDIVKGITLAFWTSENIWDFDRVFDVLAVLQCDLREFNLRFAIEDMGFFRQELLQKIAVLQPAYVSLTWNQDNRFCGGALEQGTLTKEGTNLISDLAAQGIAIDTAHLNRKSFYAVLDTAKQKICCSHTCLDALHKHPRNINNHQISALLERDAFIGLAFVKDFMTDSNHFTSDDVIRQIDYFVQKFGVSNLGIGSDFYGTDDLPSDLKSYKSMPVLIEKLQKLGYNERDISRIFYENYQRFLDK